MIVTNSSLIPRPESIVGWAPILKLADETVLAGLDVTNLSNDFVMGVMVAEKLGWWLLRPLAVGEVAEDGGVVICTLDATRCWVRTL